MRKSFLFANWEGGGNVMPTVETARKLVRAGHRVRFMSEACNRPEAEAVGAEFRGWTRALNRQDRTPASQTFKDWAAPTPQEGLLVVIRDVWCGPAAKYAHDVIEELRREPADLVVSNDLLFGVMAGCEGIGQRFVTLAPNVSMAPLPGIPPVGPGLAPARNDEERAMHAQIAQGVQEMFDSGLPALNATRVGLGLAPLAHVLDQYKAAEAELMATARAFDFPCEALPARVRYVGPQLSDPGWARPWSTPWPASDRRPMVAVGFSTTFQNHAAVLQNVLDALASLPVRTLVTLGGSISPSALQPPANSVLVESAPHQAVMSQAALVITHGGHGTVMRALMARLPMLVIPHGRDQNDNAVRITERGAGLSLNPDASVEAIRAACARLLNEPRFREAAEKLGDRVAAEAENSPIVRELESLACAAPELAAAS